mgnify:CR=1 FL=1
MFTINLDEFEGPLDLLLFFIKRDELDIYNIPIARITTDFISYIHAARQLDLEVAAEFIYMASMLMSIKARMLLPRPPDDPTAESDEFDPRTELVERLLEYQRIKEAAEALRLRADERALLLARGWSELQEAVSAENEQEGEDELLQQPTLYHLMLACNAMLKRRPRPMTRSVADAPVTNEEQSAMILERLRCEPQLSFTVLLASFSENLVVVVTFLAVLELCKSQRISVLINDAYNDVWLTLRSSQSN